MKLNKNETILSIMATFRDLAFTVLALFTLSGLLLSLVLVLFGSSWMQGHYQICRVALRPVGCE